MKISLYLRKLQKAKFSKNKLKWDDIFLAPLKHQGLQRIFSPFEFYSDKIMGETKKNVVP